MSRETSQDTPGRLYCAGWACWDRRLRVETFPPATARTRVLERTEDAGGIATVAALAAASLGAPTSLIAHTGDDEAGQLIRQRLLDLGGEFTLGATPDFATPMNTIIVAPDGERFIFREAADEPPVPELLPQLTTRDVVLLDCRAPLLALAVAQLARQAGTRVVLDLDRDEVAGWEIARLSTHVITDETLCQQLGGLKALHDRLPGATVVAATLGGAGVETLSGRIPACQVTVKDSTGAGDVFHGAYAAALLKQLPHPFQFAAAAAALRCQTASLPTRSETLALMEKHYDPTDPR